MEFSLRGVGPSCHSGPCIGRSATAQNPHTKSKYYKIHNGVVDKQFGSFFLSVGVAVLGQGCRCLPPYCKCFGLVISKNRNIDGTSSYRVDFLRLTRLIFYGGIFFRQPCRRVLETTREKKVSNLCVLLKFSGALVQSLQFLAGTPYLHIYIYLSNL